ncbi:MAG TPA: SpoIIE family protein phosphatase [Candidatus Acidoferrales bacterium]|nr:SpoIIE family protein phosphatase [Candidatus Acidoferrales bacterium]
MATTTETYLHSQLEDRRKRLAAAIGSRTANASLSALLGEVDAALERMRAGSFGICEECHEAVEQERLIADPLVRFCVDHLSEPQRRALEDDLELAARVQRALLPPHDFRAGGWQFHYCYEPAGIVSGDYCDVIPSAPVNDGSGDIFFSLGDVAGKGVAASLLMTQLHGMFRSLVSSNLPLDQLVARVSRLFCESTTAGQYATLVCGRASASGSVELCSAGHLPVFLLQKGGVRSLEATGMPLGMFGAGSYPAEKIRLDAGDSLVFYTDGLTESFDGTDSEYGLMRLRQFLNDRHSFAPDALTAACLAEVKNFSAGAHQHDDRTIMVLRRG